MSCHPYILGKATECVLTIKTYISREYRRMKLMSLLFVLLVSTSYTHAETLGNAIRDMKALKFTGSPSLVHHITKHDHQGVWPVFFTAGLSKVTKGRLFCTAGPSVMDSAQARALFVGKNGESLSKIAWTAINDTAVHPPAFFNAEVIVQPGSEFVLKGNVYQAKGEVRDCLRGRYTDIYDTNGKILDTLFTCDEYSSVVKHYSHKVMWTTEFLDSRLAGVRYSFSCNLSTDDSSDFISLRDFLDTFSNGVDVIKN